MAESKLPFQKSSIIGQAVKLALRKQGVTEKELLNLAKETRSNPRRLFSILRQNGLSSGKMTWELEENRGRFRIVTFKVVR